MLLENPTSLQTHIQQVTGEHLLEEQAYPENIDGIKNASAVMFLLGLMPGSNGQPPEPSLILNKRSQAVNQAGDLCCPGGGISPNLDTLSGKDHDVAGPSDVGLAFLAGDTLAPIQRGKHSAGALFYQPA